MSRIDQALRRVESGHPDPTSGTGAEGAVEASLDRYLAEPGAVQRVAVADFVRGSHVAGRGGQDQGTPSVVEAPPSRPSLPHDRLNARFNGHEHLVVSPDTSPVSVEQYRRLAASLQEAKAERGLKTLMVTSALPQEGKTLTIVNIALTLSESYSRRVLLVDADLHRPSIHEIFSPANTTGLAEALRAASGPPAFVEVSPRLSVLPAGRLDGTSTAALTSDRLKHVLEAAASRFDWVLVDTPPVGMLTDAQIVSSLTDGVLFVIRAGRTDYSIVQRAIAELGVGRVVGTVLNYVDEKMMRLPSDYQTYYGGAVAEREGSHG
jgi:protein-tyrosine kinase